MFCSFFSVCYSITTNHIVESFANIYSIFIKLMLFIQCICIQIIYTSYKQLSQMLYILKLSQNILHNFPVCSYRTNRSQTKLCIICYRLGNHIQILLCRLRIIYYAVFLIYRCFLIFRNHIHQRRNPILDF